jgi:hypothetical protein
MRLGLPVSLLLLLVSAPAVAQQPPTAKTSIAIQGQPPQFDRQPIYSALAGLLVQAEYLVLQDPQRADVLLGVRPPTTGVGIPGERLPLEMRRFQGPRLGTAWTP